MQLSRSAGAAGTKVTASGSGYAPGSTVELSLGGSALGSAATDGAGDFSAAVTIPVDTGPGRFDMTAVGPDAVEGTRVLSATFTVTTAATRVAAQADDDGASLPSTGSSAVPLVVVGVVLIGTGAFATRMSRKKRAGQ